MAFPEEENLTAEPAVSEEPLVSEEQSEPPTEQNASTEAFSDDFFVPDEPVSEAAPVEDARLKAVLEAIIYVTDEPLTLDQICAGLEQPRERVVALLEELSADYDREDRGLTIREIAGGLRMTTKPEHHDAVRRFVRNMNPPLKLSLPALETLAVIAYKQPITAPEIMEIRGVQGAGVLKTLLDRKLIGTAGRKQVVGKPILYKTTKEFLVQFGLKDLNELPTLKEFQELGRMDTEGTVPDLQPEPVVAEIAAAETPAERSVEAASVEAPSAEEPQAEGQAT
jgi:segregation and condensation protein B